MMQEFEFDALSSIHAEQSLLGSLMSSESVIDNCEKLKSSDFVGAGNRIIADVIFNQAKAAKPFDIIAVMDVLASKGLLESVGGAAYLNDLVTSCYSPALSKQHAALIFDKSVKRSVQGILQKSAGDLVLSSSASVVESMLDALDAIKSSDDSDTEPSSIADCLQDMIEDLDNKKFGVDKSMIPCGIKFIDDYFDGSLLRSGEVVVIAGRPSMGKTTLAMNICMGTAKDHNVGVFSLETTKRKLISRALSAEASVPMKWLNSRGGESNDDNWDRVVVGSGKLMDRKLWIDDRAAVSLQQIRKTCKRAKRKGGLKVVMVDYLTEMKIVPQNGETFAQAVSQVITGFKAIAKDLDVCVVLLSQINRGNTERAGKRPTMSDLRDSGGIEQGADKIILIHRDEYYQTEDKSKHTGHAELIVDKFKDGERGVINATFVGQFNRFDEWDGRKYSPDSIGDSSKKSWRNSSF